MLVSSERVVRAREFVALKVDLHKPSDRGCPAVRGFHERVAANSEASYETELIAIGHFNSSSGFGTQRTAPRDESGSSVCSAAVYSIAGTT